MQDDMYFDQTDAIREVREFENARTQSKLTKTSLAENLKVDESELSTTNQDYYDYSYTSRMRRFNTPDNTWGYYDPYYTNYYWFNPSNTSYFGHSVYSTYNWWGPNFGNNYNSYYWRSESYPATTEGWNNPWRKKEGWSHPYHPYAFNGWNNARLNNGNLWNTGLGFTNMYYNSFDNNCYGKWNGSTRHNFSAFMQNNGIKKDVSKRPEINYTALRETRLANIQNNNADTALKTDNPNLGTTVSNVADLDKTNSNTVVVTNNDNNNSTGKQNTTTNANKTNNSTTTNSNTNTNNNTYKRWDNHNADLNISPANKSDNSWSRSGVFSEGSRNNNYEYKGSAIPSNGNNKGKEPNK
jgi:hypothetical protein